MSIFVVYPMVALVHNCFVGLQHTRLSYHCYKMERPMLAPNVNGRCHIIVGAVYLYTLTSKTPKGARVWRRMCSHPSSLLAHVGTSSNSTKNKENQKNENQQEWAFGQIYTCTAKPPAKCLGKPICQFQSHYFKFKRQIQTNVS